jgi:RNA polymerase sigma-70 factor (ECF subfamily)
MPTAALTVDAAFQEHRGLLWHLCYRMTGIAADADDLVQETFLRAIERPPPRTDMALRPWLVRVALNLARDLLRRRRRRREYTGPWLPSPIETGEPGADAADDRVLPAFEPSLPGLGSTEGRYDLVESVTFAFLLALEALTPQQRAVLLLRDVFDYSVRETAEALAVS